MSRLTGQSADHEKLSWERPGKVEAGRLTSNCWEAKNFSFPVDFFQNQVILDRHLRAPSHQNEERLAGQVAHPRREGDLLQECGVGAGHARPLRNTERNAMAVCGRSLEQRHDDAQFTDIPSGPVTAFHLKIELDSAP